MIVVEGKTLLERDFVEKLRDLVTDLQLIDGTRGIISLFSARQPPEGNGNCPRRCSRRSYPKAPNIDQLVHRVMSNEIIRGKLLSEDGELALIVLALDPDVVGEQPSAGRHRRDPQDDRTKTSPAPASRPELSGVPVMQLEIRNAVERDRLIYNAFGFAAGCLIAIMFFRRVSFMVIGGRPAADRDPARARRARLARFPPQHVSQRDDAAHHGDQLFRQHAADICRARPPAAGEEKYQAFRNAMLVVGPACVLTHATAALSFIALLFSEFRSDPHVRRGGADRNA